MSNQFAESRSHAGARLSLGRAVLEFPTNVLRVRRNFGLEFYGALALLACGAVFAQWTDHPWFQWTLGFYVFVFIVWSVAIVRWAQPSSSTQHDGRDGIGPWFAAATIISGSGNGLAFIPARFLDVFTTQSASRR